MAFRALALVLLCSAITWAAPHKKKHPKRSPLIASVAPSSAVVVVPPEPARVEEQAPPAHVELAPAPAPAPVELAPRAMPRDELVEVRHRRYGLMGGGIALFAASWAADVGITYGAGHSPAAVSLIPVVGPLVQCGDHYGYSGPMPMTGNATLDKQMAQQIAQANTMIQAVTYLGLAVDVVGQLTGLTLAIVGASTRSRGWERVSPTGNGLAVRF